MPNSGHKVNWQKQLKTTTVQPPNSFAPNRFEYIYTQLFVAAAKAANIPSHFCTHSHTAPHVCDAHTCNIYVYVYKISTNITPSFKSASIWLVATCFTHIAPLFGCIPMNEQCHIFHQHTNLCPLLFAVGVVVVVVDDVCVRVCARAHMYALYLHTFMSVCVLTKSFHKTLGCA